VVCRADVCCGSPIGSCEHLALPVYRVHIACARQHIKCSQSTPSLQLTSVLHADHLQLLVMRAGLFFVLLTKPVDLVAAH
jgi:hypothetical protein